MFQPSLYFQIAQSFALTIVIVMCFYVAGPPLMQLRIRRNALVLRSSMRTTLAKLLLAFADALDPPVRTERPAASRVVSRLIGYAVIASMIFIVLESGGANLAQTLESNRMVVWCGGGRRLMAALACMAAIDFGWAIRGMIKSKPEPGEVETE